MPEEIETCRNCGAELGSIYYLWGGMKFCNAECFIEAEKDHRAEREE